MLPSAGGCGAVQKTPGVISRSHEEITPGVLSCTLSALERSGAAISSTKRCPGARDSSRYFQFLRPAIPTVIEGVLEHNRHDLLSLAAVTRTRSKWRRGAGGL